MSDNLDMGTVNWKRGLTRGYVLVWFLWAFLIVAGAFSSDIEIPTRIAMIGVLGLAVPAVVLALLRWIFDGFAKRDTARSD